MTTTPPTPDPRVWRSGTPNPGPVGPAPTLDERPGWAEGQRAKVTGAFGSFVAVRDAHLQRWETPIGPIEDRWITTVTPLVPVPVGHVVIDPAALAARIETSGVVGLKDSPRFVHGYECGRSDAAALVRGLAGEKGPQR